MSPRVGCGRLLTHTASAGSGCRKPTVGFLESDPALAVCVSSHPQPARGDTFLVNSVATGGTNYSLAVRATRGLP